MADYKDYIVRYDIQANVTQAAEGLRAIADIAKQFEGPMQTLSKAITQVSQAAFQLKQNSQIIFAPKIDVAGFNNQLRKMVVDVRAAATEMHTALFQALSGNPAATAAMKKGANSALSSPKNIAQIKRDIESYERELDKIYGTRKKNKKGETIRNRDGSIFYAKKANMHDRVSELEGQGKAIRQRISQLKADMAALEKLEKEAAIATTKSTGKKTTAVAKSQPAPLTNVTPAVIRQWKDAFGDARLKNLTINIRGNASGPKGAMTVIEQILTSLKALQKQASFTINPLLNPEGFAAAEAQLRSLAGLSAKVVAPFSAKPDKGVAAKNKGSKVTKANAKPMAIDVIGNVTKILPPKTELIVPVVGEMVKLQSKVSEAIPVNAKIAAGSIAASLKDVKRPTIPAHIKLIWEKGAVGRQQQLKALSEKIPPIKLVLDTTAAVAKLEEFITLIKGSSPQNIALTASGSGATGSGVVAGTGVGTRGHQASRTKAKSASPGNIKRAAALQAQFHNSMLPFGLNKSQMDIVKRYRHFFKQGASVSGITPVAGMESARMMQYLQAVSTQMQAANVPVPVQLQSYINKLGKQASATTTAPRTGPKLYAAPPIQKPFFDRARKWAYPFTGQTSFGVRTPMAVDMAKGMGVMFAIGGAMSAIGNSFSQAMEYQNTMRTTQAILQNGTESYSQGAFRNMEATVREVGVKTKFSAPEVASAARFLAMAGYDIDAINASIRPIADLALIGDSDLGETADKMTNIMTTFGIKPGQMRAAANIMATTATRSNTDLMMLAESAKYGGGVANMYGRNDPNLFADTMALFGVMGNAGIQASSAGTALRMMYQNIFKPNKNQRKVLDMMKSQYGISTLNADGSYRAMSSILTEMAQRIPENKMAEIVGNLFRITAQPGAAATLMAAAGGDKGVAEEIGVGIEAMSAKMSSKAGLSSLVSLMLANRESINGNISGAIAEEKQNTIAGLWAQVTSTFTEGIVQAFEQRQGGFEGMLKGLRDYLAKPETIQMLQNLLDMVIEIGKVMAWFIKIWANLYNMCPGLIKFWVVAQMAFTQIGTLIAPFISLIGVFNRLGGVLARLAGVSTLATTTTSRAVAGAAGASALNAPFMVGTGRFGRANVIRGNAAVRANRAIANNAILASELALSGADVAATRTALNAETRQHYAAVQARAKRMYGWARVGRAFKGGLNATLTAASVAPVFGGISKLFMGLMTGLAKAVGLLCNPITLAIAAAGGLAYGIYKLKQHMDGATEAQIQSRKVANQAADQTSRELKKEGKWYQDMMSENIPEAAPVISSIDTARIKEAEEQKARFNQIYSTIFNDFSKDASKQSVNDVATKWRSAIAANPAYFLALKGARNYDFTKKHKQLEYNPYDDSGNGAVALWNLWHADEDNAINQRNGMVQDALMIEGANDARTQQAIREITELRAKYLRGETTYKTQAEYVTAANAIRDKYLSLFTARLSAAGMTPEQFQQTSNRSVYDTYQLGATNFINATINGDLGTLVGNINAREWLADTKNKAKIYTDEWYNAISHIIGDYHVIYNAVSADGKQSANIELILSTLPNGRLNFTNILDQIREKIANFNLTIQGFSDIIGTAYKMMADAGIVDLNDRNGMQKFIRHNLTGAKYGDSTPRQYYQQWIANNPNSEWVRAGISEKQYVDFIMGRSGETINLGNRVVSRSTEKSQMWNNMSRKTADTIINQNKQKSGGGPKPNIPTKPVSTHTPAPSTSTPSAGTQDAYASHYDKSAARPTVVNININELAHFDRTSVASSAQERDLMAAMEEKIAESIYRLSMTALNNVSGYMA